MLTSIARKLAAGVTFALLIAPITSVMGTDPEPGVMHTILAFLGLA